MYFNLIVHFVEPTLNTVIIIIIIIIIVVIIIIIVIIIIVIIIIIIIIIISPCKRNSIQKLLFQLFNKLMR